MRLVRGPNSISILLLNRNAAKEKKRKRNGESINNFFLNIELELLKWVLLAIGKSN